MKTTRQNIFETNSSSTHSITILEGEKLDLYKNDEFYYFDGEMISIQECFEILQDSYGYEGNCNKKDIDTFIKNEDCEDLYLYSDYLDNSDLSIEYDDYTTKSGDKILIISEYGYDH